jgi:hypothetical protein
MKNTRLQAILDETLDRMFVVDKRGKMVFFPWGDHKQGYMLKRKSLVAETKRFYKSSFFVCFVIFLIAASIFHDNFWRIIGSMVGCFGGWYLVYYLYVSKIVKSLPVAKASYKDIVLEKLEPEDADE